MLRKFLKDVRGNYGMMMAIALLPIMGGVAVAVDYAEMVRVRQATFNALDAAGIATARRAAEGIDDNALRDFARRFFDANLNGVDPEKVTLAVQLPNSDTGGGTLKLDATVDYEPYFLPAFSALLGREIAPEGVRVDAQTEIQLKNTLEVALVLDNSGSMDFLGAGTGRKRLDLLKEAAKQLVETIAAQGAQIQQVDRAVQFSVVPFAASVNVGTQHANSPWMDLHGASPIHHENFNWATMPAGREVTRVGGVFRRTGNQWGAARDSIVTRFTLFDELQRQTGTQRVQTGTRTVEQCTGSGSRRTCRNVQEPVYDDNFPVTVPYASWAGCVETRPHPYAYNVAPPVQSDPATLFVPMFAPDEPDPRVVNRVTRRSYNNWWGDNPDERSGVSDADSARLAYMGKYFEPEKNPATPSSTAGPNLMCSTTPITPLTDVTTASGLQTVKTAIDAMRAEGATDVPEGTAWGWRTLAGTAPFPQGRSVTEHGNDKVVIVLTDGENTYYTPSSLGATDLAGTGSVYSNKGYTARNQPGANRPRMFMNTTVNVAHNNANFTSAMNQHMDAVCEAAKERGIILMTVALDLDNRTTAGRNAIAAMERCASDSRFRADPNNPGRAAKLFWNVDGSDLAESFRQIADELSNLRIIG